MTVVLETIADRIRAGRYDEAREAMDGAVETDENRVELVFLKGYLQEMTYDRAGALGTYSRVLEMDPDHTEAAFRAAVLCDTGGDMETAIGLYERCAAEEPAHINALINLAVLYEDTGQLSEAERCLEDVLGKYPNHGRARQVLKSVKSSYTMMYDERTQQEHEQRHAILDSSIADFELSVRSRNCLRQMSIRTLGDLLKTTEAELLSYKNFGETSLNEIKAMLEQKGLSLGQTLPPPEPVALPATPRVAGIPLPDLHISLASLELSVRSRKALQRLGIATLGELAERSEAELMSVKNFGLTSLNEIKRALVAYGLSLR